MHLFAVDSVPQCFTVAKGSLCHLNSFKSLFTPVIKRCAVVFNVGWNRCKCWLQ